jgi:hypothetical protein
MLEPIHKYGDENFKPDRMGILRTIYGERLNGAKGPITIAKFECVNYFPKSMKRGQAASLAGVSYMAALLAESTIPESYKNWVACTIQGKADGRDFDATYREGDEDGFPIHEEQIDIIGN